MRSLLLAFALVTLPLAGCLGGGDDDGTPPVTPPGTPPPSGTPGVDVFPFGISGCRSIVAAVAVPQASVAPHLPEGWRSLSLQEMGLSDAPNPDNSGNLGIDMFLCEEVSGLDGPIPDGIYGSLWSAVEPSEEFRREVTFHFVKWDTVIADPALRAILVAAGAPVVSGNATLDQFTQLPTGTAAYSGSIEFSNNWSASFEGAGAAPFPPTGNFVEFTAVPGGFIEYYMEFRFDPVSIGPVRVTLEGSGLATEILGGTEAQGVAFAGVQWWENGNVTIPR